MNGNIVNCNHCLKFDVRRFDRLRKVIKSLVFFKSCKDNLNKELDNFRYAELFYQV